MQRPTRSTIGERAAQASGRPVRGILALCLVALLTAAAGAPAQAATRVLDAPTGPVAPAPDLRTGQLVVKLSPGVDIDAVNRRLGSRTHSALLASRSIYLLDVPLSADATTVKERDKAWAKQAKTIIKDLTKDGTVVYAEVNVDAAVTEDDRFHYWPSGGPQCTGADTAAYLSQPAVRQLSLDAAHGRATGSGTLVAVLDTGVKLDHPSLASRLAPGGYDYVADDPRPDEERTGHDGDGDGRVDEGYGHGTFVAGVVALVAPDARILPARVLDSEGRGGVFTAAEAVFDATAQGADVINMSFGTGKKLKSKVLSEALKDAAKAGVVIVAAAGNDGSAAKHYPAADKDVLAVAALDADGTRLAGFSARGDWVDLAAPGVDISSTLPCGFGTWNGTSMAAPFVAAAAALDMGEGGSSRGKGGKKAVESVTKSAAKVKKLAVHDGVVDPPAMLGID